MEGWINLRWVMLAVNSWILLNNLLQTSHSKSCFWSKTQNWHFMFGLNFFEIKSANLWENWFLSFCLWKSTGSPLTNFIWVSSMARAILFIAMPWVSWFTEMYWCIMLWYNPFCFIIHSFNGGKIVSCLGFVLVFSVGTLFTWWKELWFLFFFAIDAR